VFGDSIQHPSLRHAMLAWASAFVPAGLPFSEQLQHHSVSVDWALLSKTRNTIDVADFYAAFLMALLSAAYHNRSGFTKYFRVVKALLGKLRYRFSSASNPIHLGIFLPLARDLFLEFGRREVLFQLNGEILELCRLFQTTIGPVSMSQRTHYCNELLTGVDPQMHFAFLQTMWAHTTMLRRCFRHTILRKSRGQQHNESLIASLVSEVKSDLLSREVKELVDRLTILRGGPISQSQCDDSNSCWKFGLLLHQYCGHLILLLEAENVFDELLSREARASAETILSLIEDNWLDFYNGDQLLPTPLCLRRFLVVRSLWISGLTLRPDRSFASIAPLVPW